MRSNPLQDVLFGSAAMEHASSPLVARGISVCKQYSLALLQLRILGFGLFQDRNSGVSVFPEAEEVLVSGESPHAGSVTIGWRALLARTAGDGRCRMAYASLQRVCTSHAQMR